MSNKKSLEEILAQLTDEQKAQIQNCKNMDEVIAMAKESDIVLSEEDLKELAGGNFCSNGINAYYAQKNDINDNFCSQKNGIDGSYCGPKDNYC